MTTLRPLGEVLANDSFRRLCVVGSVTSTLRTLWVIWLVLWVCNASHFPETFPVGPFLAGEMILLVLSGFVLGTIADRVSRQKLLVASLLTLAAVWTAFGLLCITDRLELWHVVVGALVVPIAWAGEFVARRAMIGDVVRPHVVGRAVALDTGAIVLSQMLGLLIHHRVVFHWEVAFFVVSAVFAAAALVVVSMRYTPPARDRARASPLRDVADAFGCVRASPLLMGVLAVSVAMTLGFPFLRVAFPYLSMASSDYILSQLDPYPHFYYFEPMWVPGLGAFTKVWGLSAAVGAVVVAVLAPPHSYSRIYYFGAILFVICLQLLGRSESYAISVALLCLAGVGIASFETMQTTLVVAAVPPQMRGRAMGALLLTFAPYELVAVGVGGGAVLLQPMAMTLSATGGLIVLALVGLAWPLVRRRGGVGLGRDTSAANPHDSHE